MCRHILVDDQILLKDRSRERQIHARETAVRIRDDASEAAGGEPSDRIEQVRHGWVGRLLEERRAVIALEAPVGAILEIVVGDQVVAVLEIENEVRREEQLLVPELITEEHLRGAL